MTQQDPSRDAERLTERDTYLRPRLECDVVMKGGITSGVLYPLAVCELAETYTLRSVGGTSAGAIAAAAAAAAEYGRRSSEPGSGFDALATLPSWLATGDNLVNLFQPSKGTRAARTLLMKGLTGASRIGLVASLVNRALASKRWFLPLIGVLPGAIIVTSLLISGLAVAWLSALGVILGAVIALVGLVTGAALAMLLNTGEALEENMYGLVAGSSEPGGAQSLSDWLSSELDRLAGIAGRRDPLTFGDLWAGPTNPAADQFPESPAINLEMQTTSLTEGKPYRLPHELGGSFAFDEDEFRRLFPSRVVDYLVECADGETRDGGLIPLPDTARLPVVVATRMSLSFPILISAVPLHAVDRSMQEGDVETYERCWFSDGGITSNFPVSYFDALLPSRPTFGLNLRPFHPRHPQSAEERRNVWMARTNRGGIVEWWTRWPSGQGVRSTWQFLRAIADTMQNWVDNTQTRVPGYRDRIIHISHTDQEGGMNLAMPPDTLWKLAERGRWAGRRLVDFYTSPPGAPIADDDLDEGDPARVVSWENHRWIRLRTALALVSETLGSMASQFGASYQSDLNADVGDAPGYPFRNNRQRALAQAFMRGASEPGDPQITLPAGVTQLAQGVADCEATPNTALGIGAPQPAPVFRIAPGARTPAITLDGDDS